MGNLMEQDNPARAVSIHNHRRSHHLKTLILLGLVLTGQSLRGRDLLGEKRNQLFG